MDEELDRLITRWRGGDQEAATALFHRYAERLIALARTRMSERLRSQESAEDAVQSACRSFFDGVRSGKYQFQGKDQLWGLLVTLTLHKVQRRVKRAGAQKRSPSGERVDLPVDVPARGPSPLEAAELAELIERLMVRLGPEHTRILELHLQGQGTHETAKEVQCTERHVRRVLEKARKILEESRDRDA